MKLFTWTRYLPNYDWIAASDKPWVRQTGCAVVLRTKKEFMERYHYTAYTMRDWVSVRDVTEDMKTHNETERLALANPGTCYGQDIWRHTHGEYVFVEMPDR